MKTDPVDVPSAADFHDPTQARAWAERTQRERPYRQAFLDRITSEVSRLAHGASHILELGSGPGFLADHILRRGPFLESYVLLDFSQAMLDASREHAVPLRDSSRHRKLTPRRKAGSSPIHPRPELLRGAEGSGAELMDDIP